jgi:DNA-binding transcriptional ArsR family regulator
MVAEALPIDVQTLEKVALVLRALLNDIRLSIINTIHKNQRIKVTDIYKKLNMQQSMASQHLTVLRQEGSVKTERNGKEIYYSLNYDRFAQVDRIIKQILK